VQERPSSLILVSFNVLLDDVGCVTCYGLRCRKIRQGAALSRTNICYGHKSKQSVVGNRNWETSSIWPTVTTLTSLRYDGHVPISHSHFRLLLFKCFNLVASLEEFWLDASGDTPSP
jgi:hypothetical protein